MSQSQEGTFWDHLDALRGVIIRLLILIAVLAVGMFCAMPWIFDNVILAPCTPGFPLYRLMDWLGAHSPLMPRELAAEGFSLHPVSLELTSQFFVHMTASCWGAVIVGFPAAIYIVWTFVAPALYDHEKRGIRRAFVTGNVMFYLGVCAGYFIVFPLALRFLATYSLSDQIEGVVSLDSYMDNFFTLILMMGAVFELPLLAWMLGRMGFITRKFFKKYRRHAVVALLVVAGLITPTGDPFTLVAVFLPVYALWELSALLVPAADKAATTSKPE